MCMLQLKYDWYILEYTKFVLCNICTYNQLPSFRSRGDLSYSFVMLGVPFAGVKYMFTKGISGS